MQACELIAKAIPVEDREELPCHTQLGTCCVTGEACETIDAKFCIGPSFTDHAVLRSPGSPRIGVSAYWALKYKWERMSLWWCNGFEFRRLERVSARLLILSADYGPCPWAGYITTSYKKHGCLRAPVNVAPKAVWLFDSLLVDCSDHLKLIGWWEIMRQAQRDGIGRQSMEALEIPAGILAQIEASAWIAFRRWAEGKVRSPLYQLLCYLLPSQEELKAEGIKWNPKYAILRKDSK